MLNAATVAAEFFSSDRREVVTAFLPDVPACAVGFFA
jgi:hypothetical protein